MWYTKELNQIFNELNARQGGLTEDEASKRLEKYGANNFKEKINLRKRKKKVYL